MADPQTANIGLAQPIRNSDVGVWDTPVNGNTGILDTILGGTVIIPLNNSNVTLSAAQFQSKTIIFNSTLTGSVSITFSSTFNKSYEIWHQCTGSSAFTITLLTTAGGTVVCAPPGEIVDVFVGGNIAYKNLGRIGSYWDYAGSSIPNWVGGCSVPPYINCDGTSFSSATYPALATILGGTTLPDSRGRARYALNQGTGRVSTVPTGVDGNTIFSAGGDQNYQAHIHGVNDPTHFHQEQAAVPGGGAAFVTWNPTGASATNVTANWPNTAAAATGISIQTAGVGAAANLPPALIAGLTLIRAG